MDSTIERKRYIYKWMLYNAYFVMDKFNELELEIDYWKKCENGEECRFTRTHYLDF
jgi:hypothetical protein